MAAFLLVPVFGRRGALTAFARVDVDDWPLIAEYRWRLNTYGYARVTRSRRDLFMHRLLMGFTHGDGRQVDHKNRDRLDNRRSNLREATVSQNAQNRSRVGYGSSAHRGVCWDKNSERWQASAMFNGRNRYLGQFDSEAEAARVAAAARAEHMPFSPDAEMAEGPPGDRSGRV